MKNPFKLKITSMGNGKYKRGTTTYKSFDSMKKQHQRELIVWASQQSA